MRISSPIIREDQVESFVNALAEEFYLDAGSIRDAIRYRRCFNVIHLATMFKVDIFIPCWDDYLREEFNGMSGWRWQYPRADRPRRQC